MDATTTNDSVITTTVTTNLVGAVKQNGVANGNNNSLPLTNGHHESSYTGSKSSQTKELTSNGVSKDIKAKVSSSPTVIPLNESPKIEAQPVTVEQSIYSSQIMEANVNVARSEFRFGPDQVIACNNVSTVQPNGRVKIQLAESGLGALKPTSVPGMLHKTATAFPDNEALATKNSNGSWDKITYQEYEVMVRTCAKAFLKLGLQRYHSVCILGFNSSKWIISDLGAIYAGGFAAGVYTTNSPEACLHCAESSRANIIVVEDSKQLAKILQIKDKLPELKAIVQYEGKPTVEGVLSWDDLMKIGEEQPDTELDKVLQTIAANECCSLVYTSGTVGNPKAVMLSHDNLTWTARAAITYMDFNKGKEVVISFLPLSHVAAQLVDIYLSITCAATLYFADRNALKGSLGATMQEVKPTTMLAVPRVWEKIVEKMIEVGNEAGTVKKTIATWAKGVGFQHNTDKMNGILPSRYSLQYTLANALVYRRVKAALGLERCNYVLSGAAPISTETKKYYWSLDVLLLEGFGMSESAGCHTLNRKSDFRLESIGRTVPGCHTKIDNRGEILMKGRNIFMGYLNDTEKTHEALEEDGWFHSGDVGRVDEHEFVYITGRIKEVLITAGGENIPPVLIEQTIMQELPCISHVVVIGDMRKFLTCLITLKCETCPTSGEPKDELNATSKTWCHNIGCNANTVTEITNDDKVKAAIKLGLDRANEKAISNAQRVQKFAILPKDFSIPTGELGPTMKLKRSIVYEKYAHIINSLYQES